MHEGQILVSQRVVLLRSYIPIHWKAACFTASFGKNKQKTVLMTIPQHLDREDPIAPSDRFRTSQAIQLAQDEIPASARPRARPRQPIQAQAPVAAAGPVAAVANGQAARRRPARPRVTPRPQAGSTALQVSAIIVLQECTCQSVFCQDLPMKVL